jgi:hypothetical protein
MVFSAGPVGAADLRRSVGVSPVVLDVSLSPNTTTTYDVTIENPLDQPLPVRVTTDTLNTDESADSSLGGTPDPFLEWISVVPSELIIPAKSRRTVTVGVSVPETVPFGGYYATLLVEPVTPADAEGNTSVMPRVGVILLGSVGVPGSQEVPGSITDNATGPVLNGSDRMPLLLRVNNTSLYHFLASPKVTFAPLWGDSRSTSLEDKIVFPGKTRRWERTLDLSQYPYGVYRVQTEVSVGNGTVLNTERTLVRLPFLPIGISIVTGILVWFTITHRKGIMKGIRILMAKED